MINSGLLPLGEGGRGRRSQEEGKEERGELYKAGWGRTEIRWTEEREDWRTGELQAKAKKLDDEESAKNPAWKRVKERVGRGTRTEEKNELEDTKKRGGNEIRKDVAWVKYKVWRRKYEEE